MKDVSNEVNLDSILDKAVNECTLDKEEILYLLNLKTRKETDRLFAAARQIREANFSNQVFLYGFIYFSTYCRNDCTFCYYRCSNSISDRYRKTEGEIIETAKELAGTGLHLLDLTMGEDPLYFRNGKFEQLLRTIEEVKSITRLPIMFSPGVVPLALLPELKRIGVDWYACYQETHNRKLFEQLRLYQDYDERLSLKRYAHEQGFLIEEGLLAGIGESDKDIYDSFEVMKDISADQVRVMSFVPQKGTPLENTEVLSHLKELLIIAVMRLIFQDRLIPASLDVDGIKGLKDRLNAGANVITSIIPPGNGLQGVSQSTLDIQEGGRTAAGIAPVLEQCSLKPATQQTYSTWLKKMKSRYREVRV